MKIRSGFVSNSSSSSYIIRGVEITSKEAMELAKLLGKEVDAEDDLEDVLYDVFPEKTKLVIHGKRNYFEQDDETGFIIGEDLGDLEDGSFVAMPESTKEGDTNLLAKLAKYGLAGQLKTYVKMISNDNY